MAATSTGWFEPIESGVHAAHRARDGLIAGGELAYGGYTYLLSVPYSVDCAPSLASFLAEIDDGFAFLRRTGNEQTGRWLDSYAVARPRAAQRTRRRGERGRPARAVRRRPDGADLRASLPRHRRRHLR